MNGKRIQHLLRRHYGAAILLVLVAVAVLVFGEIAEDVREGDVRNFDMNVFLLLNNYRSPALIAVAQVLSNLLLWPVVVFMVGIPVIICWVAKLRREAVALLAFPIATSLLVQLLKYLFHRHRPLPPEALFIARGASFPSGHASFGAILYGLLGYLICAHLVKPLWARLLVVLATVLIILATGVARVLLGVHFASDVLAGWIAGGAILAAAIFYLNAAQRTQTFNHVIDQPIRRRGAGGDADASQAA